MSAGFIDTVNNFGLQLLSLTLEEGNSNGVCPLNIYSCLMMLAAGSRDDVLGEFSNVLGFDEKESASAIEDTVQLSSYLLRSGTEELSSASSVWYRKSVVLRLPWKETVETAFNATLGPLDATSINDFVKQKTRGMVSQLVRPNDLEDISLMLITCLFFSAKWATPFEADMTQRNSLFHPLNGKPQSCAMMRRVASMNYQEDSLAQICILPYQQAPSQRVRSDDRPAWKAAIILPKKAGFSALQQVMSTMSQSPECIRTLVAGCSRHSQKISLSLPRFKISVQHDLAKPLMTLGLVSAFRDTPDFGPVSSEELLGISSAMHKLVVEVDEQGTKMAAVTAIGMSRSIQRDTEMRVDRPFLFLVFDDATNLVLFSVTVTSIGQS